MDLGKAITMILAGSGVLIGVYLVLSNPNGDSAAANALGSNGVGFVKALQGR